MAKNTVKIDGKTYSKHSATAKAAMAKEKGNLKKASGTQPFASMEVPEITLSSSKTSSSGDASPTSFSSNQEPNISVTSTPFSASGEEGNTTAEQYEDGELISTETVSPTVMSGANIEEETIPNLQLQVGQLGGSPTFGPTQGGGTGGGGSDNQEIDFSEVLGISSTPKKKKKEDEFGDPYVDQMMKMLRDFQTQGDFAANQAYNAIAETYEARRVEQQQSNAAQLASVRSALRAGGSSRYAPISSAGVVSLQEKAGIQAIASLDAEERMARAEVLSAQQQNNWRIVEQKLGLLDGIRSEKAAQANAVLAAAQEADKERKKQIDVLVSTAIENGAPPEVINALSNSYDVSDAMLVPGVSSYLQKGTGVVGEYLYYKRQAEAAGQVPVDFDTYSTIDANRKRPVINMGAAGLPPSVVSQVDRISSTFDTAPIVKQYNEVLNKKQSIDAILERGVGGPGDLALVFEFMKALDPTSVVRESEYAAAAKSGNIFAGAYTRFNKGYFDPKGGILPEEVKRSFKAITDEKFRVIDNQYQNFRNEKGRLIERKTKLYDPDTPGTDYLIDYAGAVSIAEDIATTEADAERMVTGYGMDNPQFQEQIITMSTEVDPTLGRPLTWVEIKQTLNIP